MATETEAGCTRAGLVRCGDSECLCNCYNFDVHGQEPALPAGYFLVVARNPGATAEARASKRTSRSGAPSELEGCPSFWRLASSLATDRSTSEKGTSAMSMRTAVSSAGDGEASDA